ncbi:uncharacterized protein A1O9_12372 [Exophiala aquamarina CBS 119918]|uniref:Mitochondrial fusion protein n=1 Tax=Exophiala aquamarina CBS 119918 TaxID=1182545 RepID=A0A072P777_9EURO|nr:uncharacterized protein A1O9_12372 [Exophiala aquamarina CBS 119918]KEF51455.1 hypothetical protein A1O9_12372 [Exophiala aquamarina CBS 119918]
MQDTRYTPNPLRPYYKPASIGFADVSSNATAATSKSTSGSPFSFPDLDYSDYISDAAPSITVSLKSIIDQTVWKYTSVVFAQPFEVAKLILQTRVAQGDDGERHKRQSLHVEQQEEEVSTYDYDHSSDDEPNYFSSAPYEKPFSNRSPDRGRRGRPPRDDSTPRRRDHQQSSDGYLVLKNPLSLMDALSSLSSNSGALAMWRATNSTFVYNLLVRTLETFFRSFLAAVFGIAESEVLLPLSSGSIPDSSILSSPSPASTVLIATAAAALSALVLAPIDAARTRLILTSSSQEPRTLLGTLRTLPTSYLIPTHLIPITFLTSTLPALISTSTPVFLKSYLGLDPAMNTASWSVATFASSALDLSIKFPLETVLRRAQIATWTSPNQSLPVSSSKRKAVTTIVPVPQSYRGVLPTIWSIVNEEGYSESEKEKAAALLGKAPRRKRKGQGIQGLYRGWRVGFWGLVGVWGTSFIGGLQNGSEAASSPGIHGGKF